MVTRPASNVRCGIEPAHMTDQPLLAKRQFLPAHPCRHVPGRRTEVGERHADVKRGGEGRARRADLLVADARVLHLHLEGRVARRR
jgi:hypothetical protein